jgi:hypothetical protein
VSSSRTIDAGGLTLVIEQGPDGPRLATGNRLTAPLAAVLNAAASGALPGLDEALERRGGAETPIERVARPHPGDEFPAEREQWRELTGSDPGDDVYVVGTAYTPGVMIVPRAALLGGLRALRALRTGDASADLAADAARLSELEEQAAAVDRLEAAGGVDERARAAVKRRLLLADLEALPAAPDATAYPLLAAYRGAAEARERYARGDERARAVPGSAAGADPAVSLDWFRLHAAPLACWSADAWLAHAEAALLAAEIPSGQAEGELFVRDSTGWMHIVWRREDGTRPVLVRAAPA